MRVVSFGLLLISLTGCGDNDASSAKICTLIGCEDDAHLTIRAPDDSWPAGDYKLELTFGDTTHICTGTITDGLEVKPGSPVPLSCQPKLWIVFRPRTCVEDPKEDAASQACTERADRWTIEIRAPGTPPSLHARIERDDELLLDVQRELEYHDRRPNGPGCEPLCRQSTLSLEL